MYPPKLYSGPTIQSRSAARRAAQDLVSTNIETAVLSTGAMQRVFLKSYLSLKLPPMFFVQSGRFIAQVSLKSGIQNWAIREFWEKAHFHRTHFPGVKGEFCCHPPPNGIVLVLKVVSDCQALSESEEKATGIVCAKRRKYEFPDCHQMTWFGPLNNSGWVPLDFFYFTHLSISPSTGQICVIFHFWIANMFR